jgi:hypothetical protein
MPYNPKSLENLAPPFKPGESGNPGGSRRAGDTVLAHINALVADESLTEDKLKQLADAPNTGIARRMAARRILSALRDGEKWAIDRSGNAYPAGSDGEPGKDFDRIMDRTVGKPIQSVQHIQAAPRTIEQAMADLEKLLDANPDLHKLLSQQLGQLFDQLPVETTAKALPVDKSSPGSE